MDLLDVSGLEKEGALNGVGFQLAEGRRLAIAGETGSGKSTLLRVLAGLLQPDRGKVIFRGQRLLGPQEQLMPGHRQIAYLSQHFELRNHYRVEEELAYNNRLPEEEAAAIYAICRIDHLLGRWTSQLSGGERQRIALARLLVSSPVLLLLDEPFSNLDTIHKEVLKSVLHEAAERLGMTMILVAHDPLDLLPWAHHLMLMKEGRIVQQGPPVQVYRQPSSEYAAALLGAYNLLTPALAATLRSPTGVRVDGRKMIVRPEGLLLNAGSENYLGGQVRSLHFYGSYWEAWVALRGQNLRVRTREGAVAVGDEVQVSLAPGALSYV